MSNSRSQAPTVSHPSMLWMAQAWASEILPHPAIAILSISCVSTAFEESSQSFAGGDFRCPDQQSLQLLVTVITSFPFRVPPAEIKRRGQLTVRPMGVFFP